MIIFSLGINRLSDGLTLSIHDEIRYNDPKLSEARKHRDEITKSLSVFDSNRNSLYLSNSKYSIHWITSAQLQLCEDDLDLQGSSHGSATQASPYMDKPHAYTTPSKNGLIPAISQHSPRSSYHRVVWSNPNILTVPMAKMWCKMILRGQGNILA